MFHVERMFFALFPLSGSESVTYLLFGQISLRSTWNRVYPFLFVLLPLKSI